MTNLLTITVNEKKYEVRSAPDTPLLYVLRNELKSKRSPHGMWPRAMRRVHRAFGCAGDQVMQDAGN